MTAIRSARLRASSWSWVTNTAVAPAASEDRSHLGTHVHPQRGVEVGERLVEQDERGFRAPAPAPSATRCCWPPDSSCGQPVGAVGEADEVEHLGDPPGASGAVVHAVADVVGHA